MASAARDADNAEFRRDPRELEEEAGFVEDMANYAERKLAKIRERVRELESKARLVRRSTDLDRDVEVFNMWGGASRRQATGATQQLLPASGGASGGAGGVPTVTGDSAVAAAGAAGSVGVSQQALSLQGLPPASSPGTTPLAAGLQPVNTPMGSPLLTGGAVELADSAAQTDVSLHVESRARGANAGHLEAEVVPQNPDACGVPRNLTEVNDAGALMQVERCLAENVEELRERHGDLLRAAEEGRAAKKRIDAARTP